MSRYIDAEWISNVYADFKDYEGRDDWTTPISNVLAVIDDAPSIDICFCRECSKHNTHRCHMAFDLIATEDDDFCSYGQKGDENVETD